MKDLRDTCRVAVVQASPVMFDKTACVEKVVKLTEEAGANGAELVVFPELFVPGYPYGMTFGFTVGHREPSGRLDWKRYYDNSILVPGPETEALGAAAKAAGVYLSIGVSEREACTATLYNTNLVFGPDGALLTVHRKLKPTGAERVVWGDAQQDYFPVADTPWGNVGSLICWESYMPLARVALYEKGVTLYISPNTNDNEEWQATIRHIAIEGHCYFINADLFFTREDYPKDLHCPEEIARLPELVCRGGSCVVDPYGHYETEPVWDKEAIIYADLDMQKVPASRMEFDTCGHYARPDVLELRVHE
jgi:nitrilase